MTVTWQFDYLDDGETLTSLYTKAKRGQWDAAERLDWGVPVDPSGPILGEEFGFDRLPFFQHLAPAQRETFVAHATAHRLSQILHGEQGALMTAAALVQGAPEHAAKLCASTQVVDEARHVEALVRYTRKVGIVYPLSPWLRGLLDAALGADHVVKQLIAMHVVIEALAQATLHNLRRRAACPLLRELASLVLVDEGRHVAFGQVYLRRVVAAMHPDDREAVAEFAHATVCALVHAAGGVDGRRMRRPDPGFVAVLNRAGIELGDFVRGQGDPASFMGFGDRVDALRDLIMPALVRVGVVTPRARERFRDAGIPIPADGAVLTALADLGPSLPSPADLPA
jgi:hypothetical protein